MVPHWLQLLAIVSLVIGFLCAGVIAFDIVVSHRQRMGIMNIVWPVTAVYLGPVGLWSYWCMGRERDGNGGLKKPFWQSVFVGSTHCGAGCSLGDVLAESIVFLSGTTIAGSAIYADFLWDFVAAYLLGIAFQYFAIVPMRHLGFREGVQEAIKADTISLVAFEIGMFLWMLFSNKVLFPHPPHPDTATYWFMMQIAMVVGFLTTYPANWLLIRRGVKAEM